jgi:hypothetical protein
VVNTRFCERHSLASEATEKPDREDIRPKQQATAGTTLFLLDAPGSGW